MFCVNSIIIQAIYNEIPIKGSIAHGVQTANFDLDLHFGRPLIEAYLLQEELYLYGVVLHHSMEQHLENKGMMTSLKRLELLRYPTPMKSGKINHYITNWVYFDDQGKVSRAVNRLYGNVSGNLRKYVDNTVEFVQLATELRREAH